jgi:hypothetical protein
MPTRNTADFPDSLSITNAGKDEFDIRETLLPQKTTHFPVLAAALTAEIRHFAVEFVPTIANKPDVIFKLNFCKEFVVGGVKYIGCIISMNEQKAVDNSRGAGACVISPVSFTARSRLACAAFQFNVNSRWKLFDMVKIILGSHSRLPIEPNMRRSLASFHFMATPDPGMGTLYRGCRDWMYV